MYGYGLYFRRNLRKVLPVVACAFLAMFCLTFLQVTLHALDIEKHANIAVYQNIQLLRPMGDEQHPMDFIPVKDRTIPVKTIFGTDGILAVEVTREYLGDLLHLLEISVPISDQGELYVPTTIWEVIKEGAPPDYRQATVIELDHGPRIMIRVVPAIVQPSYVVEADLNFEGSGYAVRNYGKEVLRVEQENGFINSLVHIIIWVILLTLLIAVGALTFFMLKTRQSEFAILQVIGYPRRKLSLLVNAEVASWLMIGSTMGFLFGWAGGFVLVRGVILRDRSTFPPLTALIFVFPIAIIVIAVYIVYRFFSTVDPIAVIQQSEAVN